MNKFRLLIVLLAAACLTISPAAAADKKAKTTTASAKAGEDKKLVDINTASQEELDALPGIGKARGAAIKKGRPYANKTQLVSKGILTQAVYDKISAKIIAKQ